MPSASDIQRQLDKNAADQTRTRAAIERLKAQKAGADVEEVRGRLFNEIAVKRDWLDGLEATASRLKADHAAAVERERLDALDEEAVEWERYCAGPGRKLVLKAEKHMQELAETLAVIGRDREHGEELNHRLVKAGRQPITPAEDRVRRKAIPEVPAKFEDRDVYYHSDGSPVMVFNVVNGKNIPQDASAHKVRERIKVQAGRAGYHITPQSLTKEVVLPGLSGGDEPLWPPRPKPLITLRGPRRQMGAGQ